MVLLHMQERILLVDEVHEISWSREKMEGNIDAITMDLSLWTKTERRLLYIYVVTFY